MVKYSEITNQSDIFTNRVRSTTGRLCFDTCLSIHLSVHTRGGVTSARSSRGGGGGDRSQVQLGGTSGIPPRQTWLGDTLMGGTPRQTWLGGTPMGGTQWWGVPHLVPPFGPGQGGYPDRRVPHFG